MTALMLRMRKWRASLLVATVARRGALVLDYRRGKRIAHLWRTAPRSSIWVIQLIDSCHIVLSAHRWHDARRKARQHVGIDRKRERQRR